uniref:Uncharacterized protein n=1 Tax=Rhizophora mucronata TaxID=61149 RepID=A0A2P2P0W9_RHIMU
MGTYNFKLQNTEQKHSDSGTILGKFMYNKP